MEKVILFLLKITSIIVGPIYALCILENVEAKMVIVTRIFLLIVLYFYLFSEYALIFSPLFIFVWYKIYTFAEKQKEEESKNIQKTF